MCNYNGNECARVLISRHFMHKKRIKCLVKVKKKHVMPCFAFGFYQRILHTRDFLIARVKITLKTRVCLQGHKNFIKSLTGFYSIQFSKFYILAKYFGLCKHSLRAKCRTAIVKTQGTN